VLELLALPEVPEQALVAAFPWLAALPPRVAGLLRAEALYAPYLARHAAELRLLEREERLAIPSGIDFSAVPGLSNEMRQRLSAARPASLGAAGRVQGVTPAAVAALAVHLRRGACST
jgi:tRNA uridine 5-carboxymethylaminomethyl modification enzyme